MTKDGAMTLWNEASHSSCHNWQGSNVLEKSLASRDSADIEIIAVNIVQSLIIRQILIG